MEGEAFAKLSHEIHIVDDLRARALVRMDILGPEKII